MQTLTVSAADVSLFHVAATVYGDATAWLLIADANPQMVDENGFIDPMITSMTTLTIPDYVPSASGGAPQQ